MFGRFWHVWLYMRSSLFHTYYFSTTYMLGHEHAILSMLRHWDEFNDGFGLHYLLLTTTTLLSITTTTLLTTTTNATLLNYLLHLLRIQ